MKFNKKKQNAILMCLYLARSGMSKLETISLNLGISEDFIQQIARRLRLGGIISTQRGPGGGCRLARSNLTILDVVMAISDAPQMKSKEINKYQVGTSEQRAFLQFARELNTQSHLLLSVRLSDVIDKNVKLELSQLDNLTSNTQVS